MTMLQFALVLCSLIYGGHAFFTACYDIGGVKECFDINPPFTNSMFAVPESPDAIKTWFELFTRENADEPQILLTGASADPDVIRGSNYAGHRRTAFIVHGYTSDGDVEWIMNMKDALLKVEDVNVIVVDWEHGADSILYNQAVANTRVVGALTAHVISTLLATFTEAKVKNMYIIGHSLGAHIAGYAGERISGLGRITGLDPAGPLFEGTDPRVRLDAYDAAYVDIIHTDDFFGFEANIGDADFYPNGGSYQPWCWLFFGDICDHGRAHQYFIESISSECNFTSAQCDSYLTYDNGDCSCDVSTCVRMGYYAHVDNAIGTFYLKTKGWSPFCKGG